jgi:poly-gamma-glutamate synthesis protein (capsule biosynthesis protein)
MLDRNVKRMIDKYSVDYIFSGVKDEIRKADLAVANLEGVFSQNESIALKNNKILRFTFDPVLARELSDIGFDIFSQANNHTNDFGRDGIRQSFDFITQNKMQYFGDYFNESVYLSVKVKNTQIGFVGFNEFSYQNFENVLLAISRSKETDDFTVVFPHWGVEYKTSPSNFQESWAKKFIDSGADIVVGAHPHVVQDVGEYNNVPIYYSLGNFVFDQYFSTSTMSGLALKLVLNDSKFNIQEIPLSISTSSRVYFTKD